MCACLKKETEDADRVHTEKKCRKERCHSSYILKESDVEGPKEQLMT